MKYITLSSATAASTARALSARHPLVHGSFINQSKLVGRPFSVAGRFRNVDSAAASSATLPSPLPFPLDQPTFEKLRVSLLERKLPVLRDVASSTPAASLAATLADFLPKSSATAAVTGGKLSHHVRIGGHLIYFPPQNKLSELLPDGTDPLQSPGRPFDKRMWAGGRITQAFEQNGPSAFGLEGKSDAESRSVCIERIADVKLKGDGPNQKIFVSLERRIGPLPSPPSSASNDELERSWLSDLGNCGVVERRDLVFMVPQESKSEKASAPKKGGADKPARKPATTPGEPDFKVTLDPSESLLFRFSALTFNAHRIHLDRAYCRDVEGHRNLLVHGPLSCTLMLDVLDRHLQDLPGKQRVIDLTYRNLAPVYADEPMTVCVRRKDRTLAIDANKPGVAQFTGGASKDLLEVDDTFSDPSVNGASAFGDARFAQWDCWVENGEGRLCVRGTAISELR